VDPPVGHGPRTFHELMHLLAQIHSNLMHLVLKLRKLVGR
jgi:hypothetical protein